MVDLGGSKVVVRLAAIASVLTFVSCETVDPPFDDGKRWHPAYEIDELPNNADRPQVAFNAAGHAIAVWDQTEEGGLENGSDDVWAKQRVAGEWTEAQDLAGSDVYLEDSLAAQIAAGGDGSAIVVFLQFDPAPEGDDDFDVWSIRHSPSEGWHEPVRIGDRPFDAARPQIALDRSGNALAVWEQVEDVDGRANVWFSRYRSDSASWEAAQALQVGLGAVSAQVAMDSNGNAIVVWERIENERSSISSRRLPAQGPPEDLLNVEAAQGNAVTPRIAIDAEGNAIAVWAQQPDHTVRYEIRARRYDVEARDWMGQAEAIGPDAAGDGQSPAIAIDADGNAIAVWTQLGENAAAIWANRYLNGIGWRGAQPIGPTDLSSARRPQIATSPDGEAVAVWVQFDGLQDSIWSNRFVGEDWRGSQPIEDVDGSRAFGPQVAVDANGNAVAVWVFENQAAALDVWSSHLEERR